jgi:hypothetical protein
VELGVEWAGCEGVEGIGRIIRAGGDGMVAWDVGGWCKQAREASIELAA